MKQCEWQIQVDTTCVESGPDGTCVCRVHSGRRNVSRTGKRWTDQHHHEELRSQEWLPIDDICQSIQQVCIVSNLFSRNRTKRHWQALSSLQTLTCSENWKRDEAISNADCWQFGQHNTTSALLQQNSYSVLHGSIKESIVLRSYKMEIVCLGVSVICRAKWNSIASAINVRHKTASVGQSEYFL